MVDIRLGIEHLAAWLHNYDAHHQQGHDYRAKAALKRLHQLRCMADDPELPEDRKFAAQFAYLRRIEPMVFEEMVLEAFRQNGHMVRANVRYTGDGGIDGRVWVDDWRKVDPWFSRYNPDRIVRGWAGIQCKRYEGPVRQEHLRQFPADLARAGLVAGFFVHTGTTPKARTSPDHGTTRQGLEPPVQRISGRALLQLLTQGAPTCA